jgi:peptidoglycan/LPS O-acetylase OafA/YrhL
MGSQSSVAPEVLDAPGHSRRIQTLDGLRAIAILLVICDHYIPQVVSPGGAAPAILLEGSAWAGCGVDLFFVLSGFLITGILVDARGSANYFRRFYWRRSLRIFPAFYALLLFAIVVMPYLFRNMGSIWFALYLRNWLVTDGASDGSLGHLWSLAVEEQFYIAWSVAVFLCPPRYLVRVILVLIGIAPLVRVLMHYLGYPGYLIYRVTPARMDSLLYGALVAVAIRSGWASQGKRLALLGLQASLVGLVILRMFLGPLSIDVAGYQFAWPTLIALSFASLLFLCLHLQEKTLAHRLLTCSPFRIVAKYSYAIYLWHLIAGMIATALLPPVVARPGLTVYWYAPAFIALAFSLALTIAALSWLLIESPALRLKDRCFSSVQRS